MNNKCLESIVSYPDRGPYGNSSYRGNCSGHLVRDLLSYFRPNSVLDPMEGSGTTRDVCKEQSISYTGYDLKNGFDLTHDPINGKFDFVFFHPPYWDMVKYSDNPVDLSNSQSYDVFLGLLGLCLENIHDSLNPNGIIAVLIGDKKKNGKLYPIFNDVINFGIGRLFQIIIKIQHNTKSSSTNYSGKFIPIMHEYVLLFKKGGVNDW